MIKNLVFSVSVILIFSGFAIGCGCNSSELGTTAIACAGNSPAPKEMPQPENNLEKLMSNLEKKTESLKSYQAKISSVFLEPLLEAQTTREGMLYYAKKDDNAILRVNFATRQIDEEPAIEDRQEYIFDGVWLTRINYTTKHVEKQQIAEVNAPEDVLGLVSRNFPLIGFSNIDRIKQDFDVSMIDKEKADDKLAELKLIPKKGSKFSEDYSRIDFWVDLKASLPAKIEATTSEEDIYQLIFSDVKFNKTIKTDVFKVQYPDDFTLETKELNRN